MNILKKEFGQQKQWCNWRFETIEGKITKVPYFSKSKKASSTNQDTWRTYDDVEMSVDNGSNRFNGIGLFFPLDEKLLGIDLDGCLENGIIKHEKKSFIESFVKKADTYVEISPSGNGLHLFLKLTEPLHLEVNKEPKSFLKTNRKSFEVYTSGRYFTVTNKPFGEATSVRTITKEEGLSLLSILGYPWKENKESASKELVSLDDSQVLKKMFGSKNGKDVKSLYDGDVSKYKGDDSSADMALCNHLAFWTAKNPQQIERIWLSSPLGKREKTRKRQDYRQRTIENAIKQTKEVYETQAMKVLKESPNLDLLFKTNKEGEKIFIQNTENICRVLRHHPNFQSRFRYDVFKNTIEILPTITNKWRIIEDNDAVNIQTAISILFPCFAMVGKTMVYEAMIKVAKENTIDSASDYIRSLVWDGASRLDTWLESTYGAEDSEVNRAIGSNWIKGLVKRIIEPGCKFDYVLVLEGEQGVKKSTSLHILGGSWHVETTMSTDTKDFFMQFQGKAIIEFSEGETLSRTEVKRMKAIITMQSDKYRPPYERTSQEYPRRCVFAMTTNQDEYLKDETGNRRWLPVKVILPEANIEWLQANREQLFAEAYHRVFNLRETIYEFPKEIYDVQMARQIKDPNEDAIIRWYYKDINQDTREDGITINQVYRALHGNFPNQLMKKYEEMTIGNILKNVLNLDKKQVMRDGVRSVRWFRKGHTEKDEDEAKDEQIKLEDHVYNW